MKLRDALLGAVKAPGAPSSDYDLNKPEELPERTLRDAGVLVAVVEDVMPRVILTKPRRWRAA